MSHSVAKILLLLFSVANRSDDFRNLYNLMAHENSLSAEDWLLRTIVTLYLLRYEICFGNLKFEMCFENTNLYSDQQILTIQVSLGIRRGYVPEKFGSANTKTAVLGLNLRKFPCYSRFSPVF